MGYNKPLVRRIPRHKGSNMLTWEVDTTGGTPLGAIWTFVNTTTESHPYHVKPLDGEHKTYPTLSEAKKHFEIYCQ